MRSANYICKQLLCKHDRAAASSSATTTTPRLRLINGCLGAGKTHTARLFVKGLFEMNANAQVLYLMPFHRKRAMDSLFPLLPSLSNKLHIETLDSMAEKLMEYKTSDFHDNYQVLNTPQERLALFIANFHELPLNLFRTEANAMQNASLLLAYFKALKQCGISSQQLDEYWYGNANKLQVELAQCYSAWNKLLEERRIFEREDLIRKVTREDSGTGFNSLLRQVCDFKDDEIIVVADDFHLLKPIQVELLRHIAMRCANETNIFYDEASADSFSSPALCVRERLDSFKGEATTTEFTLAQQGQSLPTMQHLLPGMENLAAWATNALGTKSNKKKRQCTVICTKTKHERDQVFALLQQQQEASRFLVRREHERLIQNSDIQAILAMLTLLLSHPSAACNREWFLVLTSHFFPAYRTTPKQVKEFGQRLTRQRMEGREILTALGGDALKLVQEVDAWRERYAVAQNPPASLSTICMDLLKQTGVCLDPYSAASERIAFMLHLLKRIEFNNTTSTPLQVLESLRIVLEREQDADYNDFGQGSGDEEGEEENGAQALAHCQVATMHQVCQDFEPRSIDKLCLVDIVDVVGKRAPLWKSLAFQGGFFLPLLPWELMSSLVHDVPPEESDAKLLRAVLARAKDNVVHLYQQ